MTDEPTVHELKVALAYFDALLDGSKTFEVRKNDRGFQRDDLLRLREWDGDPLSRRYTGREVTKRVGFVYSGDPRFGLDMAGHVVLSLLPTPPEGTR